MEGVMTTLLLLLLLLQHPPLHHRVVYGPPSWPKLVEDKNKTLLLKVQRPWTWIDP
jgi:hypothetical protein